MRILHVVGAMNRAGTETMLMNIYRNVDRKKVQFDFISYSDQDAHYDDEIKDRGGRVIKLSKTNSIQELYHVINKYGPYDAVHAHTLFHCGIAAIAAYLAGVKIRISHAHTTMDSSSRFMRKAYIKVMRFIINHFSTNLLACSEGAGKYLFGNKGLAKSKYSYFPNTIEYLTFLVNPQKKVTELKVKEGLGKSIVIGHIGRFIEAKNHEFILEIMKCLINRDPAIKLLLVGDGNLRRQIEEKAEQEGILENIRFTGIRHDISTMLHSMDVFIFPSHYEGLGLVLLEAQACGLPAVVSEAIQPEADLGIGLISKLSLADGPDVWADRIVELAGQKEKNTYNIINGFEKSGYSLKRAIATLMTIYQSSSGGQYERDFNRQL
ncbi:glycosyltransferase EpsF [Virgibacillus subterraneus]|uniref:Glycosyltransferase EpsF n=1 Tax=Virgibacillus subterraneus TaxID=621109 RepID=A0A1H8ZRW5_9BACI|nr:glycosyltransferase family 1 protein [Virgibacillus subterraneus]SEP67105.1 glycosyltransferase EpsF [Virgibacillus subterraneus]